MCDTMNSVGADLEVADHRQLCGEDSWLAEMHIGSGAAWLRAFSGSSGIRQFRKGEGLILFTIRNWELAVAGRKQKMESNSVTQS